MAMDMDKVRTIPSREIIEVDSSLQDNHVTYTTPYAKTQFYGYINGHPVLIGQQVSIHKQHLNGT